MRWADRLRGERPVPVSAADVRRSAVSSAVDLVPPPTPELIRTLIRAAEAALEIGLETVAARGTPEQSAWTTLWPGEHYRLLAGLVEVLQPRTVIEIGTFHGIGTLALAERLPAGGELVTFDIMPWRRTPDCILGAEDFADGHIRQEIADLSDPAVFEAHAELLRRADLVFLDAPKDGRFEPAFLALALPLWRARRTTLVFDDIRLLAMTQLWRDLPLPKLDATSFGHWSGTGLAVTG